MKVKVLVSRLYLTPCDPMDYSPPASYSCPWNSPGESTGVGTFPSPRDLPVPGIKLRSSALQVDSLPSEPPEAMNKVLNMENIDMMASYQMCK